MQKAPRRITADDFEIGKKLMVSRSRQKPEAPGQVSLDFMLKGAVIEVQSLNLPFVLATACCPMRGKTDLIVDIRDHEFIRVSSEFANAVLTSAAACELACAEGNTC